MRVILASASPRRRALLEALGWRIDVRPVDVPEVLQPGLPPAEQAMYLAARKAMALLEMIGPDSVVLAADTLVVHQGTILGKPADLAEARHFLQRLSGDWHTVFTGVAVATASQLWLFYESTAVRFHKLLPEWIEWYLANTPPLDKAGAYGAQDFIGLAGIAEIHGDFYNVMGLPVQRLLQFWYRTFGHYWPTTS
ncbi:MAG: Maf family protein [Bacteroidia bacterium]|nr:Maf family protein [Bacteroidia bacterium]MDW8089449.1 Maf family protein [Bacteroidia bacterium]